MAKKPPSSKRPKQSSSRRPPASKENRAPSRVRGPRSQPPAKMTHPPDEERRKPAPRPEGGVAVGGDVTNSTLVGRDLIQQIYSSLPVPPSVKTNARLITMIYSGICELFAIIATRSDIRQWQLDRFPPMLTPHAIQENLPLPSLIEMLGMFLKNNVLFFGLGVLVAMGIVAVLGYMQRPK